MIAGAVTRVVSHDGTEIGYRTSGHGPPLVLVHGAPADHTRWRPLLPHLEPHATVHALDRRGRGMSDDGPTYRLARELEDVAAVVDDVAEATRRAVDLYGHSFGGLCAFGAATLTPRIRRLVLYEGWPPVDPGAHAFPSGVAERVEALLAEGNRDEAVATVFREGAGMTDEEIAALRAQRAWHARVAVVHTVPREVRAIAELPFDPDVVSTVTAPTLLVTGSDSNDPFARDLEAMVTALPDARVAVLAGQQHVGDILAPELFAERLVAFLRE